MEERRIKKSGKPDWDWTGITGITGIRGIRGLRELQRFAD
jgi:hypothetical protein